MSGGNCNLAHRRDRLLFRQVGAKEEDEEEEDVDQWQKVKRLGEDLI